MNLNLDYYLRKYDGFLSNNECDQVLEEIEKKDWKKHNFYGPETGKFAHSFEFDNLFDLSGDLNSSKKINERVYNCFQQYVKETSDEFASFGIGNSSYVRYNRYKVGQAMSPHCDHILTLFMEDNRGPKGIPILSMIGALNDNFEGGEFIMWQERIIPIPKGSVIIFPSIFLYPHHVEFVKKGTRYSFVSWAW